MSFSHLKFTSNFWLIRVSPTSKFPCPVQSSPCPPFTGSEVHERAVSLHCSLHILVSLPAIVLCQFLMKKPDQIVRLLSI